MSKQNQVALAEDDLRWADKWDEAREVSFSQQTSNRRAEQGLWTKRLVVGGKGFRPLYEIRLLRQAYTAGLSEEDIREVVRRLHAARADTSKVPAIRAYILERAAGVPA